MRRAPNDAGFTLVEVLVSLAIFSLAIVGLNRAATLAVSGTSALQIRTHAGFVADNAVVLTRIAPLELGIERFEAASGGMDFDVVTETSPTEQAGFYEITAQVFERDQERVVSDRRAFRYEAQTQTVSTTSDEADDE
ncbi:MAG: type II secretion system protein [Litorimonas sp.]